MGKRHNILMNKKILVFQKSGFIGGAEKNLQRWIEDLSEKYNVTTILCGPGKGKFFEEMASRGIKTYQTALPDWRKGKNFFRRYLVRSKIVADLSKKPSFDLIFSNDFFYAPYAVYLGKNLHLPVVIHIQSDCEPKRIHQYSLDEANGVIITTRSSYEKINPYFKPDLLQRIPYGVEIPFNSPMADSKFRKNPENVVFGVVANLLSHKGIEFVFKLANSMIKTSGWEIHWVGGDPQNFGERFHARVTQEKLNERLFFHGFCENMSVFYQSIDCLIHPAQFEPFGIVLIEAMSHGLPVISTRTKGGVEVLGDIDEGHWLVDLDGWIQMEKLMKQLMTSREKIREVGKRFEEKFQKEYLFSQSMEKMESLFSKVLVGASSGEQTALPDF